MKQCKCGNLISAEIRVKGKVRRLGNRTNCLKCVPFGKSPYSNKRKTPQERRSYNAEKMRSWRSSRIEQDGVDPIAKRRKEKKREVIEYLGGGCMLCSYHRCMRNLAFHHVVKPKTFTLGEREFQFSWEKLIPEIAKCIVVCHNCHGEIHEGLIDEQKIAPINQRIQPDLRAFLLRIRKMDAIWSAP